VNGTVPAGIVTYGNGAATTTFVNGSDSYPATTATRITETITGDIPTQTITDIPPRVTETVTGDIPAQTITEVTSRMTMMVTIDVPTVTVTNRGSVETKTVFKTVTVSGTGIGCSPAVTASYR